MKHVKLFENFSVNESFWVNLQPGYKEKDKNGQSFLNLSGVPGGYNGHGENFIDEVQMELEKSKHIITPKVVTTALKAFRKIDDATTIRRDLKKDAKWWLSNLHGTNYSGDSPDDRYNYPGAAYLIWWLSNNQGKKISEFSF